MREHPNRQLAPIKEASIIARFPIELVEFLGGLRRAFPFALWFVQHHDMSRLFTTRGRTVGRSVLPVIRGSIGSGSEWQQRTGCEGEQ